jgi:hypothetical protein
LVILREYIKWLGSSFYNIYFTFTKIASLRIPTNHAIIFTLLITA